MLSVIYLINVSDATRSDTIVDFRTTGKLLEILKIFDAFHHPRRI